MKFGDGSTVEILGKGSILLQCKNGDHRFLSEVYYIPKLRSNIISLGQMIEDGFKVEMIGEFLKVYDETGTLLMPVKRTMNRLYKIQLTVGKPPCLMMNIEDPA